MISLRREILEQCPELDINRSHPIQVLWFVVLAPLALGLSYGIVAADGTASSFYLKPLLSLALGSCLAILGLFAHELLHGTIIKPKSLLSRVAIRLMAWFSFLIFGLSPEVWMSWHNQVHHYHTNQSGTDPDSFGLWDDFQQLPMRQFLLNRAPGSKHWLSWLYLSLNFNNQVLSVWYLILKGNPGVFKGMNKPLAVVETILIYLFWAGVAAKAGLVDFLWIFLVPLVVANLVESSYILVQHLLCPLSTERTLNDPLENTLGVEMIPLFKELHLHFGYHVEHHIFPEMNHSEFPRLREFLKEKYPTRYRCTSHFNAVKTLLTTPRIYENPTTLFDPISPASRARFDVSQFGLPKGH